MIHEKDIWNNFDDNWRTDHVFDPIQTSKHHH